MVLTGDNFKSFVQQEDLVIVDFWAPWCGPCRMLSPILEELEEEGLVKVGKVNVDEEEAIALAYGIQNIPALFAFKGGRILGKKVGFLPKNMLVEWIKSMN